MEFQSKDWDVVVGNLSGADLASWVAKAEGLTPEIVNGVCIVDGAPFAPQENWAQGGPIIDREDMCTDFDHNATVDGVKVYRSWYKENNGICDFSDSLQGGATTLEAAMRCRVARAYGHEFDLADIE